MKGGYDLKPQDGFNRSRRTWEYSRRLISNDKNPHGSRPDYIRLRESITSFDDISGMHPELICHRWLSTSFFTVSTNECECPKINCVRETKYLGIKIDDRLTWKPHIELLVKKLRPIVACLAKLGRSASRRVVLQAYHALFESHLRYGIIAYGSAFRSLLVPLEKIQNSCMRIIARKPRLTSADPLYEQSGIMPLRKLYLSVLLTKLHTSHSRVALQLESENILDHPQGTRGLQAGNLRRPAFRLKRTRRLYTHQYLAVYNKLPESLSNWKQFRISKRKKNIREFIRSLTSEDIEAMLP